MIILIDINTVILTATPLPPQLPPRIPVFADDPVLSSVSNSTPADLEECATAEPANEPVEEGHDVQSVGAEGDDACIWQTCQWGRWCGVRGPLLALASWKYVTDEQFDIQEGV